MQAVYVPSCLLILTRDVCKTPMPPLLHKHVLDWCRSSKVWGGNYLCDLDLQPSDPYKTNRDNLQVTGNKPTKFGFIWCRGFQVISEPLTTAKPIFLSIKRDINRISTEFVKVNSDLPFRLLRLLLWFFGSTNTIFNLSQYQCLNKGKDVSIKNVLLNIDSASGTYSCCLFRYQVTAKNLESYLTYQVVPRFQGTFSSYLPF